LVAFQAAPLEKLSEAITAICVLWLWIRQNRLPYLPLELHQVSAREMQSDHSEDGASLATYKSTGKAEKWVMHRRKEYELAQRFNLMMLRELKEANLKSRYRRREQKGIG